MGSICDFETKIMKEAEEWIRTNQDGFVFRINGERKKLHCATCIYATKDSGKIYEELTHQSASDPTFKCHINSNKPDATDGQKCSTCKP